MAVAAGTVQFSIGRVFGDSIGVFMRNFVSFAVLALLISLIDLGFQMLFVDEAQMTDVTNMNYGLLGATLVVAMIVAALTQAAIIYGTFQDLRGQKASIGDCIARGLSSVLPVIIGSLLATLGIAVGLVLLVIPGIILAMMWWVYIPAIVVERKGIMEAFGRSMELTSGRRWSIFGLAIIVFVIMFAINFVIGLFFGVSVAMAAEGGSTLVFTIVQYAVTALVTAFSAVLVAVGYYYLRAEKEGVDVNTIASVFD